MLEKLFIFLFLREFFKSRKIIRKLFKYLILGILGFVNDIFWYLL